MPEQKKVRIPLDLPQNLKEKAIKDSKAMYGFVNVNAYLRMLIETHKPTKK